ncbi:ABC transporter permease subunit [Rhodobacteraceae bacterium NNCM2]|nr:ABC transporter permease subunit [Coraliihabitans acroporae]
MAVTQAIDTDRGAPVAARLLSLSRRRDVQAQATFLVVIGLLVWGMTVTALNADGGGATRSGFGFLWDKASFELGESLIPFGSGDTYGKAFVVGLLNTLKVAVLGIILSTFLGLALALGQLSPSVLTARFCRVYIEVFRNVPLLLQLIFWHTFLLRGLPVVRQALSPVEGVFLTNRGLFLPAPVANPVYDWVGLALLGGFAAAGALRYWRRRRGAPPISGLWFLGLIFTPPLLVFLAAGAPLSWDMPALAGFNFKGGITVTPEFAAMLMGLTLYTAAFNAEIIRAGILGVDKGQTEAGFALGLRRGQVMRLIVIPQTLRIVIPPMTNSYLNLTKESSLAVAIGYPEIVRVANITLAETNQSVECIALIMVMYLGLSLITSLILNIMNARAKREER